MKTKLIAGLIVASSLNVYAARSGGKGDGKVGEGAPSAESLNKEGKPKSGAELKAEQEAKRLKAAASTQTAQAEANAARADIYKILSEAQLNATLKAKLSKLLDTGDASLLHDIQAKLKEWNGVEANNKGFIEANKAVLEAQLLIISLYSTETSLTSSQSVSPGFRNNSQNINTASEGIDVLMKIDPAKFSIKDGVDAATLHGIRNLAAAFVNLRLDPKRKVFTALDDMAEAVIKSQNMENPLFEGTTPFEKAMSFLKKLKECALQFLI